jgi:predicted nucleotidyltransferase
VLPNFIDGLLPDGIYELSLSELRKSMLVTGPAIGCSPTWDRAWRAELVDNLDKIAKQLWQIGITEIFIYGSFVVEKDKPNDIDIYFLCEFNYLKTGQLEEDLKRTAGRKIRTWPNPMTWNEYHTIIWNEYHIDLNVHTERQLLIDFPITSRQTLEGTPRGVVKIRYPGTPGANQASAINQERFGDDYLRS